MNKIVHANIKNYEQNKQGDSRDHIFRSSNGRTLSEKRFWREHFIGNFFRKHTGTYLYVYFYVFPT